MHHVKDTYMYQSGEAVHAKAQARTKRKRTRSGCLTCRRKRRKCDEVKPVCMRCSRVGGKCEWDRISSASFRHVNQTLPLPPQACAPVNSAATNSVSHVLDSTKDIRIVEASSIARDGSSTESLTPEQQRHHHLSSTQTPVSSQTERAAAHLLSLSQTQNSLSTARHIQSGAALVAANSLDASLSGMDNLDPELINYGNNEDGVFLPGSAYLNLHSTLRNHLMQEGRSAAPTRCITPIEEDHLLVTTEPAQFPTSESFATFEPYEGNEEVPLVLDEKQESLLWMNWLDEVAPWLDKFDHQKHFQHTLSPLAQSHSYVRYAILAVSARQLERRQCDDNKDIPSSLALYQQAIHSLLPQLATRSIAVIASCVVLCVLEMLSCSPKAWQRHLDGCATLLQAVGIHGFSGGLEQALFWCFARMDVCGSLILSVRTLIPLTSWTPEKASVEKAVSLFKGQVSFDMHANLAVYLTANVADLLATHRSDSLQTSLSNTAASTSENDFVSGWRTLWGCLEDWYQSRVIEMHPVFMSTAASSSSLFPTILFSNSAAISGNQQYHTAALLMLQSKPQHIVLSPKPHSIFWHARRIVGISKSNNHHGCWTNSLQPLWLAGKLFSSPAEHQEILALLDRIEKESGWATKWRADDLIEWWGD